MTPRAPALARRSPILTCALLGLALGQVACLIAPARPDVAVACLEPTAQLGEVAVADLDDGGVDTVIRATIAEPWRLLLYPATASDTTCPTAAIRLPDPSTIAAIPVVAVHRVGGEPLIFALVQRPPGSTVEIFDADGARRGSIAGPTLTASVPSFVAYNAGQVWFGAGEEIAVFEATGGELSGTATLPAIQGAASQQWLHVAPTRTGSSHPFAIIGSLDTLAGSASAGVITLDRRRSRCVVGCPQLLPHSPFDAETRGLPFDAYSVDAFAEPELVVGAPAGLVVTPGEKPMQRPPLTLQDVVIDDVGDQANPDLITLWTAPDTMPPVLAIHADYFGGAATFLTADLAGLESPRRVIAVRAPAGQRRIVVLGARAGAQRCFVVAAGELVPCS